MDDLTQQTLGMSFSAKGIAMTNPHQDHYRVLNVSSAANRLEIREAYLRLKGTYGAGSAALYSLIDEDEAARNLAEIETAFKILNDDHLRKEYDQVAGNLRESDSSTRQGAIASFPKADGLGAERFLRMRESAASLTEQQKAPHSQVLNSSDNIVRTQRSTLSVIKLRAELAGTPEVHEKMRELVAGHDAGDGDLYRQLREICQVSCDELQERTKVSVAHIDAIETNRFERLPQAVYVKGFLASYFKYLDVPAYDKLVSAFSARLMDWQANKKN